MPDLIRKPRELFGLSLLGRLVQAAGDYSHHGHLDVLPKSFVRFNLPAPRGR